MQPPSREVVLQLTNKRNAVPLPLIQSKPGIRLPPEKYCLTAANFQFNPKPKPAAAAAPAGEAAAQAVPVPKWDSQKGPKIQKTMSLNPAGAGTGA